MTSYFRTGVKHLLAPNEHTVSFIRQDTAECHWTRHVPNLHVSLIKPRGRVRGPLIDSDGGAGRSGRNTRRAKPTFMYLRVVFFELIAPSDPRISECCSLKQPGRQQQTRSYISAMTVDGTSFPWKHILAAYAEPYGSPKTVATTGYMTPVPGVVPN